jgi:exopolysaccharide production protein ExoZ
MGWGCHHLLFGCVNDLGTSALYLLVFLIHIRIYDNSGMACQKIYQAQQVTFKVFNLSTENKFNFFGITTLRAIAATAVLIVHSSALLSFNKEVSSFAFLTNIGVDIFFVISGFIITYAHWNDFGTGTNGFLTFIKKRLIRIYPMYFLFTITTAFALLLMPQLFFSLKSSLSLLISSLLFIPTQTENGDVTLLLAVAWTLSYEIAFYVIFSVSLFFKRKIALPVILSCIVIWSLLGTISYDSFILSYFLTTLPLEFAFGMLVCILFKSQREQQQQTTTIQASILIFVSLLSLYLLCFKSNLNMDEIRGNYRFTYFGIPALFLFISLYNIPTPNSNFIKNIFEQIGNASYVTYLSHFLTIGCIKFVMKKITFLQSIPLIITVLTSCILCTFVGIIIHKLIEAPTLNALNRNPKGIFTFKH